MLFDTHAHMDDHAFDPDRAFLLETALPQAGIGLLMNPGCSLASSRAASGLSQRYDYIYSAVGSHPDAADEVDFSGFSQAVLARSAAYRSRASPWRSRSSCCACARRWRVPSSGR